MTLVSVCCCFCVAGTVSICMCVSRYPIGFASVCVFSVLVSSCLSFRTRIACTVWVCGMSMVVHSMSMSMPIPIPIRILPIRQERRYEEGREDMTMYDVRCTMGRVARGSGRERGTGNGQRPTFFRSDVCLLKSVPFPPITVYVCRCSPRVASSFFLVCFASVDGIRIESERCVGDTVSREVGAPVCGTVCVVRAPSRLPTSDSRLPGLTPPFSLQPSPFSRMPRTTPQAANRNPGPLARRTRKDGNKTLFDRELQERSPRHLTFTCANGRKDRGL